MKKHWFLWCAFLLASILAIAQQGLRLGLPLGHTGDVNNAVFSPDGETIITLSKDRTVKAWDVRTGKFLYSLDNHAFYSFPKIAFSPDSKILITSNGEGSAGIRVWDAKSGNCIDTLSEVLGIVKDITFSKKGKYLLIANGRKIDIWETGTYNLVNTLNSQKEILSVDIFGNKIVAGSRQSLATIWDFGADTVYSLPHPGIVKNTVFSADGKHLLTISADSAYHPTRTGGYGKVIHYSAIYIWDVGSKNPVHVLKEQYGLRSAVFIPGTNKILINSGNYGSGIWHTETGELKDLSGNIAAVSPDGQWIASVDYGGSAHVYNVGSGAIEKEIDLRNKYVYSLQFSPDSKMFVTTYGEKAVAIWSVQEGRQIHKLEKDTTLFKSFDAIISPDGRRVATTSFKETKIWDASSGEMLWNLGDTEKKLRSSDLLFSNDNNYLVTTGFSALYLWEVNNRKLLQTINDEYERAFFDPSGAYLAAYGKADSTITIWSFSDEFLQEKLLFKIIPSVSYMAPCMAFSHDSKYFVAAGNDAVQVWDIAEKSLISACSTSGAAIERISIDPEKNIIRAESSDGFFEWDIHTRELLHYFEYFNPTLLELNTAKNYFVTADENGFLRLWDIESGELINSKKVGQEAILNISFNTKGNHLLACDARGSIKVLDAETLQLIDSCHIPNEEINSLQAFFHPDSDKIIIASNFDKVSEMGGSTYYVESAIITWNMASGEWKQFQPEDLWEIQQVVYYPEKNQLLISTGLELLMVDLKKEKITRTIEADDKHIHKLVKSPVDEIYFTATSDNTVEVWRGKKKKPLHRFAGFKAEVVSLACSPDGRMLAIITADDAITIIDINNQNYLSTLQVDNSSRAHIVFPPNSQSVALAGWDNFQLLDITTGTTEQDYLRKLQTEGFIVTAQDQSKDGKLRVSIGDNTAFVLHDQVNQKELVRQFSFSGTDYLTLLHNGYYKSTQDATKALYYIDPDNRIITFDQLDVKYNRPDKVLQALGNQDKQLIGAYKAAYEKRISKLGVDTTAFQAGFSLPEAAIANSDQIAFQQESDRLKIRIQGHDSTFTIDRFNVWVNESPVFGQRGMNIRKQKLNVLDTTITIQLSQGENIIEASITNINGIESYRMPLYVNYEAEAPVQEKLYFIGIGIDKYAEPGHDLSYSVKDIRDLAKAFRKKYGDNCMIDTVLNEQVTTENILALKARLQSATVNDKVVLAYSGHGLLDNEYNYYLSTHPVSFSDPSQRGLPYEKFESLLDSINPRKKLMLIDACHSGELDRKELQKHEQLLASNENVKEGAKGAKLVSQPKLGTENSFELMQELFLNVRKGTGATIISAASGTQFAYEKGNLKNGVFTYAILTLMEEKKTMNVQVLKKEVGITVEEITNGLQKPTSRLETNAYDWSVW